MSSRPLQGFEERFDPSTSYKMNEIANVEYRLVKLTCNDGTIVYEIVFVAFDSNKKIIFHWKARPIGGSIESVRESVDEMVEALKRPVLEFQEKPSLWMRFCKFLSNKRLA